MIPIILLWSNYCYYHSHWHSTANIECALKLKTQLLLNITPFRILDDCQFKLCPLHWPNNILEAFHYNILAHLQLCVEPLQPYKNAEPWESYFYYLHCKYRVQKSGYRATVITVLCHHTFGRTPGAFVDVHMAASLEIYTCVKSIKCSMKAFA